MFPVLRVGGGGCTYRENVVVGQSPYQRRHRLGVVVDAPQQHALVANSHACLVEPLRGHLCDPRDLVGVVEVRVEGHGLARRLGLLGDINEGIRPPVRAVDQAARGDRQALGGEAEPADVRDADEALADHPDVLGLQVVRVSARDDNVL